MLNAQNIINLRKYKLSSKEVVAVYEKVIADYPQYFWVSKYYSYVLNSSKKINSLVILYTDGETVDEIEYKNNKYELTSIANREIISSQIEQLNTLTAQFISTVPSEFSDFEKEKIIHDFVIQTITYDNTLKDYTFEYGKPYSRAYDVYGALCGGSAVCEGYSKLFQYLCYCVGINCTQVAGETDGTGHMWNAIMIEEEWYLVDTTWNDTTTDLKYYGFFNLTDSELSKTHKAENGSLSRPCCNSTKYSISNTFVMAVTSPTQEPKNFQECIDLLAEQNESHIILKLNSNQVTEDYLKTYFFNKDSAFNKYANELGYKLSIGEKYTTIEDFIYIELKK